jgi:uncharacterized protein (UPF0332 family)
VKPEADRYLDKARQSLAHARAILAIDLGEEAGRAAYLGAFEWTNRAAKTHRGVHGQFLRLVAGESRVDPDLRRFLSQGYKLKAIADYETGPDAVVPLEQAAAAIETTDRFIRTIAGLLG